MYPLSPAKRRFCCASRKTRRDYNRPSKNEGCIKKSSDNSLENKLKRPPIGPPPGQKRPR
jgi:hypothetical protein